MRKLFILFLISSIGVAPAVYGDSDSEKAGDALRIILPLTAFGATFYLDDRVGRRQFYKSFFTNLGVTYALKFAVDKERPDGSDNDAFPSGHTSVVFQSATFIQKRYGWKYGLPAYAAATFVGWSRLQGDPAEHDEQDVLAGAAIGVLSSYFFTSPYDNVQVTASVAEGVYAVEMSATW